MIFMTYSMPSFTRLLQGVNGVNYRTISRNGTLFYRYYDMWRDKPDPTADSLLERLLKKLLLPIVLHRADRPERRL